VEPVGGVTLPGLQLRFVSVGTGGSKVSPKVLVTPFNDALMVAVVLLATAVVVTAKFAVEDPALTVTGEDTVAEALLLDTVTLMLLTALPLRVIVQVEPVGGVTLAGLHDRPVRVGAAGWLMVITVPPPVMATPSPLPSDADALLLTDVEVLAVAGEI
jgi:hypothetical protein